MQNTSQNMWANNKGFNMADFTKPDPHAHTPHNELPGHERIGKYNARITHADLRGIDPTVDITTPDFDTEAEARAYALHLAHQTPRANRVTVSRIERDSFNRSLYGKYVDQIDSTDAAWNEQDEATPTEDDEHAVTTTTSRRNRRASNRTRRATLKTRTRTQRATAKIRRQGVATLATHCIAAGLGVKEARTVASSLRKNAAKAGVTGTPSVSYTHGKRRACTRYTSREVALICLQYKPRKAAYRLAAARLALAA
jgi:hypothetical protein